MNGWVKKRLGCADIYTKKGVDRAIVDRRGFGIMSALGHRVTYDGKPYRSVEEAIKEAEKDR